MKEILASLLLLIAVVVLYLSVAEGPEGTKAGLQGYGSALSNNIRGTDP
ncbi:hypothetical protein [Paenibacillus herberti]|nr:hypothetical protein [Paenibacillus herberti]